MVTVAPLTSVEDMRQAFQLCGPGPFVGQMKQAGTKYGFIKCDVTERHFGTDVFVLRTVCPAMHVGMRVMFTLKLSDKGQPQADSVELLGAPAPVPNMPVATPLPQMHMPVHKPQSRMGPIPGGITSTTTPPFPAGAPAGGRSQERRLPPGPKSQALEIFKGTVKNVSPKGFGFIHCPQVHGRFHRDAHLDIEEMANVQEGQDIYFLLKENEKGQPSAKIVPPHGKFNGVLKSFDTVKGFGFIECAEANRIFKTDVFIHRNEVEPSGLQVGEPVEFTVALNARCQPQAVREKVHVGTIRCKGKFTFIDCVATKEMYGKDVFVVQNDGLNDGEQVQFTVTMSDKGQPQAATVESMGVNVGESFGANGTEGYNVNAVEGYGMDAGGVSALSTDGSIFEGRIKSIGPKYGFIECAQIKDTYGGDVFLKANDCAGVAVDDTVCFSICVNARGQPQAQNMKRARETDVMGQNAKKMKIA